MDAYFHRNSSFEPKLANKMNILYWISIMMTLHTDKKCIQIRCKSATCGKSFIRPKSSRQNLTPLWLGLFIDVKGLDRKGVILPPALSKLVKRLSRYIYIKEITPLEYYSWFFTLDWTWYTLNVEIFAGGLGEKISKWTYIRFRISYKDSCVHCL